MTAEPLAALPTPVATFDGYQPIRIETTTGQVREVRGREVAVRADALVARLDTGHVVDLAAGSVDGGLGRPPAGSVAAGAALAASSAEAVRYGA